MKTIKSKSLFIFTLFLSLVFIGCSEKSATRYSDKNPQYAQLAKYTKIAKVVVDGEVKAFANITYLNGAQVDQWDDGYQHFLIGLYGLTEVTAKNSLRRLLKSVDEIDGEIQEELVSLIDERKISQDDSITKDIPFKNSWASYKIIKYKDIKEEKTVVLRFSLDEENYQDIAFIKE